MAESVTPMIHVPDVRATVEWYRGIGFSVTGTHADDGVMSWAALSFGSGAVMFNDGGHASRQHPRARGRHRGSHPDAQARGR